MKTTVIIANWRTKALVAAGLSLGIHAVGFAWFAGMDETPNIAGGAGAQVAMLGNSFADMVAAGGILQPLEGEEKIRETKTETVKPVEAPVTRATRTDKPVEQTAVPLKTEALKPDTVEMASLPDDLAVLEVPADRQGQLPQTETIVPLNALPIPQARPRQEPEHTDKPEPERVKRVEPEKQKALPDKAEKKKEPTVRPKKVVTQGTGKGTSSRNAIKGNADGRRDAKSGAAKGNGARTASLPGNAAVSNYPGKVYSKIRRTRQRRAGGRGVVSVRFSVNANGGLGTVSVARGSGNSSVDRAALDHIRRSAPFPPPPPGAKTRFVIPVEVRG